MAPGYTWKEQQQCHCWNAYYVSGTMRGAFIYILSYSNSAGGRGSVSSLTEEETEGQKGEVICPRLLSQKGQSLDLNPNLSDTGACVLLHFTEAGGGVGD